MSQLKKLEDAYIKARVDFMEYKLAQLDGRRQMAENRRLRDDPDFIIPPRIDRSNKRLIARHMAGRRLRSAGKQTMKLIHAAAMFVMVCTIAFTAAFAISPTFRTGALNLAIETFEKGTRFRFSGSRENSGIVINSMLDGFTLKDSYVKSNSAWYMFKSETGEYIKIVWALTTNTTLSIDTENAVVDNKTINGNPAVTATKGTNIQILITNELDKSALQIDSSGVSMDDLLEVSKNIIF